MSKMVIPANQLVFVFLLSSNHLHERIFLGFISSGKEVRRTQDVKLEFVSFIRFIGFNFGHVQLLRFVVVMVQS